MSQRIIKGGEYLLTEVTTDEVFTPGEFTDEHKQIADTTEQFVVNEVFPHIEEIDNQNFELVVDLIRKGGELGLLMVDVPEENGGLDLDKVSSMLVTEKLTASGAFSIALGAHTGIGSLPLVYYGTAEQKERYIERLTTGEWIAAYCLTEPGAGSDAMGAATTAILSEDKTHYVLNGTKQFITNGGFANLYTVFAKVDKEHFTAFLVERDFAGVSAGAEEKKMGIKGSSTTQVILANVKVPVDNLLGEIGKGHKIAFNILNLARFKLGAGVLGASKLALVEGVKYANERKQFGKTIASFGAIKEKFANQVAEIFASESLVYRLAGLLDSKLGSLDKSDKNYFVDYGKCIEEYAAECAMAKVFCSEVLASTVDETVQVFGGYGYSSEYPAERFYRDERIYRIFEGTNEINRIVISSQLLGKANRGDLPIMQQGMDALKELEADIQVAADVTGEFSKEKQLLNDLKKLCLMLIAESAQRFGKKIQLEQEVLLTLADMSIQLFAMESAVLRAEKSQSAASEKGKELLLSVAQVFTFNATDRFFSAAKKCIFYVTEGEKRSRFVKELQRASSYDVEGLLTAKRTLAEALSDREKYLF